MKKTKSRMNEFNSNSKVNSFPLNNTINCYHRPHINYNINIKNKIKSKKTSINNTRNLKEFKKNQFFPKIESRLITFPKMNNSFDKENIELNVEGTNKNMNINTYSTINNDRRYNLYKNKICISPTISRKNMIYHNIRKKSNKNNNSNYKLLKYNKKSSISKNIAILCKIINEININSNDNEKNDKTVNIRENKLSNNLYKIIKIQRWWRNLLYKLYIEKYIVVIQNNYRKYVKRKKNKLKSIIIIQKLWKKYLENKCLNDYYFFSFKKHIKPIKINNINKKNISTITLSQSNKGNKNENNKIRKLVINKKCFNNSYITKSLFKNNQIYEIIWKINQIQKNLRQYLFSKYYLNNNNNNNFHNLLIILPRIKQSFISKEKKYNLLINPEIIYKIKKIQKNIKYYFATKNEINQNLSNITFNVSGNINIISPEEEKADKQIINQNNEALKKIFVGYISYKLSKFFILLLKRINMILFIRMLNQRIKKNINQYLYTNLFNRKKFKIDKYSTRSYFFETIWRHIKINLSSNNEVALLLRNNIPKFFHKDFSKGYIPFINSSQEDNIIKSQLFLNNDEELINYIFYYLGKEKNIKININKNYIKQHLKIYNLKNRNIFYINKYINYLWKELINKKLNIINKCLEKSKDNNSEENVEENYSNDSEDNNDIINNSDNDENNRINNNNNYICHKNINVTKNLKYKFMDYFNNNNENK